MSEQGRALRVGASLASLGIDHFIPLTEEITVIAGRRKEVQTPLLGNYVLMAICSKWQRVQHLKYVSGIILNSLGFPAQVLPRELSLLREMCPDGIASKQVAEIVGLAYGDKVRPRSGPLANLVGRYDGKRGRNIECAVFSLFGREQTISFSRGELLAVDQWGQSSAPPPARKRPGKKFRQIAAADKSATV